MFCLDAEVLIHIELPEIAVLERFVIVAGPREARNPNLDSDQRIAYYACAPCL